MNESISKIKVIIDNILYFTSEQIGIASGSTTGHEESLMNLRKSAAEFAKATYEGNLNEEVINQFEADLFMASIGSSSGFFSSFKNPLISDGDIQPLLDELDNIRDSLN